MILNKPENKQKENPSKEALNKTESLFNSRKEIIIKADEMALKIAKSKQNGDL